ncbi:MAG: hypothetical protein QNK23_18080 [Crocinitomicaceae bacterium]|nr:hypothetical protein [Crocinitomicaceae bacterium]
MLINEYLFGFVAILLSLGVLFGIRFIAQRYSKNSKTNDIGNIAAFVGAVIIIAFAWIGSGQVYMIDQDFNVGSYRTWGAIHVELDNGKVISEINTDRVTVINNTSTPLFIEKIIYGGGSSHYTEKDYLDSDSNIVNSNYNGFDVFPYTAASIYLERKSIDYFFDDEIPDEIRVPLGSGEVNYWLRKAH